MDRTWRALPWTVALSLGLIVAAGCGPGEDAPAESETPGSAADTTMQSSAPPEPDTTAEALHAHLEASAYAANWPMWPDREALYQGADPHGMLLTTYLNATASSGLQLMRAGEAETLPDGSIVVKENYMQDSTLAAVTVMYKRDGYDPEHNDWFWVKHLADGTFEASGRVTSCTDCHAQAAENWDYLMTAGQQFGN